MQNKSFLIEITLAIALISILVLLLSPMMLLMPDNANTLLLLFLIVVFLTFSTFVWNEIAHDEREIMHRSYAGRVSFFVGSTTLIAGILVQSYSGSIDPWLIFTLITMVFAKIITRIYSQMNN